MTRSIGPKEAQRRALREAPARRNERLAKEAQRLADAWGHPVTIKLARKPAPKPRKPGLGEPKRMGRPPRLKAADYAAVDAADKETLAIALKQLRQRRSVMRGVSKRARARKLVNNETV